MAFEFLKRKNKNKIDIEKTNPVVVQNFLADGFAAALAWTGEKFPGSFGLTKDFSLVDYETLRKRSYQLFVENMYAKGLLRRLIRNEIHSGIVGSASVVADILWPDMDEQKREEKGVKYSELLTQHFELYGNTAKIFDFRREKTFGDFQEMVRLESLVCGDGIIVSRINPVTNLPYWDWINGNNIFTPMDYTPRNGNRIVDGVELDKYNRHVAYHVRSWDGEKFIYERFPVKGEKSGRRIAWMVYGGSRLIDEVRGEPLLAGVFYMLKELDRYRDAEERAAVINAMLPLFVKKSPNASMGARPSDGLGRLSGSLLGTKDTSENVKKNLRDIRFMQPGTIFDDLAAGEEVVSFQTNRPNVNYSAFETAILNGICWSLEIPPEIATLRFQSNYSASRQANNEFEIYLGYAVKKFARCVCQPIYEEFVLQSALAGTIDVPGLITAAFDLTQWEKRAAWLNCTWTGLSRPSVDPQKEVNAALAAIDGGLSTYDIECRKISGIGFRQVMQKRKREEEYMSQIGFVPKANENNNGEPAYPDGNKKSDDEDEELENGNPLTTNVSSEE